MDTISADELKFKHPFSMLLSGARRTGKTHFAKMLLTRRDEYITQSVEWIFWFSPASSAQSEVFTELRQRVPNITFVTGLPSEDIVEYKNQSRIKNQFYFTHMAEYKEVNDNVFIEKIQPVYSVGGTNFVFYYKMQGKTFTQKNLF